MKSKFNFFTLLLILGILLSISSVAASDDLAVDDALNTPQDSMAISEVNDDHSEEIASVEDTNSLKVNDENSLGDDSTYSFSDLAEKINSKSEGNLTIEGTYRYDETKDSAYKGGIAINKDTRLDDDGNEVTGSDYNFTIIGQNLVIDGNYQARAFNISGSGNIVLKNVTFKNCYSDGNGGAIYTTARNLTTCYDVNFYNNTARDGGAVYNDGGFLNLSADIRNGSVTNHKGYITGNLYCYDGCNLTNVEGTLNFTYFTQNTRYWDEKDSDEEIIDNFINLGGNISGSYSLRNNTFVNEGNLLGMYCSMYNCSFINNHNGTMNGTSFSFYSNCNFTNNGADINISSVSFNDYDNYGQIVNHNFINNGGNIKMDGCYLHNTTFINNGGNISLGKTYYTTAYGYNMSWPDGSSSSIYYSNFTNIGGNISSVGLTCEYSNFTNYNGKVNISSYKTSDYRGSDPTRRRYVLSHAMYFRESNLINVGANFSSQAGSFERCNITISESNFSMSDVFGVDLDSTHNNITYSATPYFSYSNITIEGGNVSFGSANLYYSNLLNNYGNIDFTAETYPFYYFNTYYNDHRWDARHSVNQFSYANFTNVGGNISCESPNFDDSNIINDHGNMNFTSINGVYEIQGKNYSAMGWPRFEYGNITNLGGNFSLENGGFYRLNIINDDGTFNIVPLTYSHVNSSNNEIFSRTHLDSVDYLNITNTGNMSIECDKFYDNNIENSGNITTSNYVTNDNNITNRGVFIICDICYDDGSYESNRNLMYGNSFENYGKFSINGNSTYFFVSSYDNKTYTLLAPSNITNYGDFEFDGGNVTAQLINYNIINFGNVNLTKTNIANVTLKNSRTVNTFADNIISNANITGGKIVNTGQLSMENINLEDNELFNNGGKANISSISRNSTVINDESGEFVLNSHFIGGEIINNGGDFILGESGGDMDNVTIVNNKGDFTVGSSSFECCDVSNLGGLMDVKSCSMTDGNLTLANGTFISSGYFRSIDLNNDGGNFLLVGEDYVGTYANGTVYQDRSNGWIGNSRIANNGNMEIEAYIGENNITNNGNFTVNGTYTSNNDIINNGNFNVTTREDHDANFFSGCNIENNGNFSVSKNTYNNNAKVTNINNYGHLEYNGLNETILVENNNISNYGEVDLISCSVFGGNITNLGGKVNALNSEIKGNQSLNNSKGNLNSKNSTFEGSINNDGNIDSVNDTYNGAILSNGKSGSLNLTDDKLNDVSIENNGNIVLNGESSIASSKIENGGSIALNGESVVSNSQINGGKLSNGGNADLIDSNLTGIDLVNNGNMSLSGSDVSGTKLENNGDLKLNDSNLSGSKLSNNGNLDVNGGSVSDSDVVNNGHISAKDSNIAAALSNKDSIFGKDISSYYGSGVQFSAVFTDDLGNKIARKTVSFAVNGRIYKAVTDSNGLAKLNVQLSIGKYTVQVINPMTGQNKSFAFTVTKIPTKIVAKRVVENYGARKYLVIKVTDPNGKAVSGVKLTVKLNKRTYTVTAKNGVAKLRLPVLMVGSHKAAISSKDAKYSVSGKATVKVNKAKTSVKAPKLTAKAKKTKYFKITLKSKVTKKAVKNVRIKVKVYTGKRAKVYKLKTNKKGLAKFNVKILKKGSHKVVISSLNKNYKISKKSKIVIK